jgi:glycosyltransferase involved in cell wall biosynthesis
MPPPRLVYVVNDGAFFLRHRGELARAARDAGYDVHVAVPADESVGAVEAAGFECHRIRLDRSSHSAAKEAAAVGSLYSLFQRLRPDIAHLVTIKPMLYGGVAARLARVPAVVFAVSGLGYVFLARGTLARLRCSAAMLAYRAAFAHPNARVIFQNAADRDLFVRTGAVDPSRARIIPGSGVDLHEYRPAPEPPGAPLVVLPARMLRDKGVAEFVAAAEALKASGVRARFALVGPAVEQNRAGIPREQLEAWARSGAVEWWGPRDDMPAVYRQAAIVCLPSYREGIPRALIEAACSGRPVVTTYAPGCRDAVRCGPNGLLVEPRDVTTLTDALRMLIENPLMRWRMGNCGRCVAERDFAPSVVIGRALDVYAELSDPPRRLERAA